MVSAGGGQVSAFTPFPKGTAWAKQLHIVLRFYMRPCRLHARETLWLPPISSPPRPFRLSPFSPFLLASFCYLLLFLLLIAMGSVSDIPSQARGDLEESGTVSPLA